MSKSRPDAEIEIEICSARAEAPGDRPGAYPTFEHVVGAPSIGISSNPYIDHGPDARGQDLSHLFPDSGGE